MIESDYQGRTWLGCNLCKHHIRRITPFDQVSDDFAICEQCSEKIEYLMDNFGRIENLLDGEA